jgi:hypothetical protein
LVVVTSSATVVAAPDDEPYEPPPFTRFPDEPDEFDEPDEPDEPDESAESGEPDEPDELPPVHHDDEPSRVWPAVRHAFDGTTLELLVGFNAPLELAAGVELVLPWRIRLGTSVGVLPRSVERAGNAQLVEHGAYARSFGELVDASAERALLWHAHLAVKPWKRHGFLATVGYGVAWIHGTATVPQVADAIGIMIPDDVPLGDVHCDVRSRLPLLDAELGWEWRWHRHWSLRVNLGAAVILGARTHVTLQPPIDDDRLRDLMSRAQAKIDHVYTTYGKTPLLSVLLGFQL